MDRRNFFNALAAGAAAPLAAGAAQQDVPQIPDEAGGLLMIRLNVGCLPPHKAEAYLDRCKDKFKESMKRRGLLRKWETLWTAVRPPEVTDVKVFTRTPAKAMKELEPLYLDFFKERPDREELSESTQDYVLMMLGAPVLKIELDPQQLKMAVTLALDMVESHYPHAMVPEGYYRELVRMGSLARAKIMLGRIRSKFDDVPGPQRPYGPLAGHVETDQNEDSERGGPPLTIRLDGKTLLEEGNEEYKEWLALVVPADREDR